jgi:hypothetical protein
MAGALLQGVIYGYRHMVEGAGPAPKTVPSALARTLGKGEPAPPGTWVVGWGVTWFTISMLALASPSTAGSFSLLIIVSTILLNGQHIGKDVGARLNTKKKG